MPTCKNGQHLMLLDECTCPQCVQPTLALHPDEQAALDREARERAERLRRSLVVYGD